MVGLAACSGPTPAAGSVTRSQRGHWPGIAGILVDLIRKNWVPSWAATGMRRTGVPGPSGKSCSVTGGATNTGVAARPMRMSSGRGA